MARGKNAGRWVELKDGRTGILYNRDAVLINGKFPVYVSTIVKQGDLFALSDQLQEKDFSCSKIMVKPEDLKTIGFID